MAKNNKENPLKGLSMQQIALGKAGVLPQAATPEKRETKVETNSSESSEWERFAFVCSSELVFKVKTIAKKEGFTIRSLMEYMMTQGISAYEKKNGVIDASTQNKSVSDIM